MKTASSRDEQDTLPKRGGDTAGADEPASTRPQSIRRRVCAWLTGHDEGNALIELAFVAPIMMIMLTGLASFSMALYSYQQLGYATSATAQQVGAQQGLITDPCSQIQSDITNALPGWKSSNFSYSVIITDSNGTNHSYSASAGNSFSCTAGASQMAQNEPMSLTVSYQYSWFSVFTWKPNNAFTPSGNLTVSEAVLVE